jgi:hypothetical protein
MALETRSLHPTNLWPGRKATFGRAYKELPKQYEQLFEKMDSTKAYEEIVEQTGYGLPVIKNEGQPVTFDLAGEGYKTRLTALVWALGWAVSREAIDDNQYKGQGDDRSEMLAFSMRQGLEQFFANVFNFAFDGTNRPIGDGQAWMSTAHPTPAGNQANRNAAGMAFSEAALEDEYVDTMLVKNARGLRINVGIKRLIHPPQLALKVTRVLKSDKQSGNANNDTNALKMLGAIPETFNYRYLTDPDAWFLQLDIKKSLMCIERDAMELSKDNDWSTESAFAKARWRGSGGPGDWRGFRGNPGPS